MMYGFYPPQKRGGKNVIMHSHAADYEIFKPNKKACPRIEQVQTATRTTPEHKAEWAKIEKIIDKLNTMTETGGRGGWGSTTTIGDYWGDAVRTRFCNNMPFQCNSTTCLTDEEAEMVMAFDDYDSSGYLQDEEASRLTGGNVILYIHDRMLDRLMERKALHRGLEPFCGCEVQPKMPHGNKRRYSQYSEASCCNSHEINH